MLTRPFRILGPFALIASFVAALCPAHSASAQFNQSVLVPTGNQPAAVYTSDINADGIPDLIVIDAAATPSASTTRVLLGDGQGHFNQTAVLATTGMSIAVSNLLLSQNVDLVWASVSGNIVSLLVARGLGDGTFGPAQLLTSFPVSGVQTPVLQLAITDYRPHFARCNIIIEDIANATLYEAIPNPDGTFAINPLYSDPGYPILPNSTGLLTADLNADGTTDVVIQSNAGDQVVLEATASANTTSATHVSPAGLASTLLADMDGDQVLDLITSDATGRIDIFHGNNDGTFANTSEIASGANLGGPGTHLIAAADLNADGIPDVIIATPLGISVLLGQPGLSYKLGGTYDPGPGRTSFALADFNRDGHLDLAIDNPQGVLILYGKPDGSFAAPSVITGTLSASPEPSQYAANFTLTATVPASLSGTPPSGTVTFSVDGAMVGTPVTVTGNTAAYTVVSPSYLKGTHTIGAVYSGDSNYGIMTLTGSHTISGLRSQTTYENQTPTAFYGQIADGRGSVAPIDSAATATINGGTISFFQDGVVICTLPINGMAGTCPDSAGAGLSVGTHTIIAMYSGNDFYEPSASDPAAGIVQVLPDITTAAIASSANPATLGQPVTFTATIAAPFAIPTGTVTFYDGATLLGSGTLNASGTATLTTSSLSLGTHNITVSYAATTNFNASVSLALPQVIVAPALTATTTLVSSSINPSYVGQTVTFTATVAASGGGTPTGTVNFTVDGVSVNPLTLSASGTATITASALTQGKHTILATYNGSGTLAPSTSATLMQQVNAQGAGGFTLTVSPSTLAVPIGSSVSVLVTVTPLNGFAQPVNFSCADMPDESTCTFANANIAAGGGSTRLTLSAAAPHNCGTETPYFVASGPTTLLDALATATIMFLLRRRRALLKTLALALILIVLPTISGCAGNCTDLGVRPGTYSFTVTATSTGSPSVTVSQAAQFTAHL